MSLKQWLALNASGNRRVAPRRVVTGFAAGYQNGSNWQDDPIRDISATGLFLFNENRWQPGTQILLNLHRAGTDVLEHGDQCVSMNARAVRSSRDGVGLAFELPRGFSKSQWVDLVESAASETPSGDVVNSFRMARSLAFLTWISAPAGNNVCQRLRSLVTGQRFWNAIEIALQADAFLATRPNPGLAHCSPALVLKTLEDGSWAEEDVLQRGWAGILAAACLEPDSESQLKLTELFSQLTLPHFRILGAACTQAEKNETGKGMIASQPLVATADEIMRVSGFRDFLRMERALQLLAELGLVEESYKTSMCLPVEGINITPTPLGLQLYAHCAGHLGTLGSFYGVPAPVQVATGG